MRKFWLFILLLIFSYSIIYASKHPFGNFRMSYRDNPQHSAVIGWSGTRNAMIYFDTVSHGTNTQKYRFQSGVTTSNHYKGQNNNFVRLSNLQAGTRYFFILKDTIGNTLSRPLSFKTLPENASSLLIIAGGDSRNSLPLYEMSPKKCRVGFRNGNILASKIVPDVIFFGGDFRMNKFFWRKNSEWQQWLSDWQLTITPDGLLIPIIPAIGNHESSADLINFFDMPPTNGIYTQLFGGNLISLFTLNNMNSVCNPKDISSTDSLFGTLSPISKWQMVQYHIPMNPQGKRYRKREDLIKCWSPLFQKWGIDIVSECHAHIIKTTFPVVIDSSNFQNPFTRNDSIGIVFIGEGAWGAPLREVRADNDALFDQAIYHGFHVLQVNRDSIIISQVGFKNVDLVAQNPSDRRGLSLPENLQIKAGKTGKNLVIKR
ncbi:MAG: metallophosphoesterase family protein [Bacteroidota bacterium]